jgi:uncharacterized protein GlcG (DUF336 family)
MIRHDFSGETRLKDQGIASLTLARLVALLGLAAFCSSASAQLIDKKTLSLEAAEKVISAAKAEARANQWKMVIAVVDDGGHLIAMERMDGAQLGSLEVAPGKAKTALNFLRPTKAWEDAAKTRPAVLSLTPTAVLLEGGIPIVYQGQVIGAVGVSGASSQQDAQVAEAGARALGFDQR